MLDWTGERYLPWLRGAGAEIHYEHLQRYALASSLVRGKRVLDVGSGEGYGSFLMAASATEVVGIDYDATAIEHARGRYGHIRRNLRFVQGSITEAPFPVDGQFDVIACFEVIEHVASPEVMLAEVARLLAPGGTFLVSTPNKGAYTDERNYHNAFHLHEYYFDEFDGLLRQHFPHVAIVGQRVFAGCFTWDLTGPASGAGGEVIVTQTAEGYHLAPPEAKQPMYFIAVASQDAAPAVPTEHRLFDVSNGYADELFEIRGKPRLDALAREMEGMRQREHDLEQARAALDAELARERGRAEQAESRLRDAAGELTERERDLVMLETRHAEALAQEQLASQQAATLRTRLTAAEASTAAQSNLTAALQSELATAQATRRRLERELAQVRTETTRLSLEAQSPVEHRSHDVAELHRQLDEARVALRQLEKSRSWQATRPLRQLSRAVAQRRAPLLLNIDDPAGAGPVALEGIIAIRGWAFGPAPISLLELLCDGAVVARGRTGIERPDVAAALEAPKAIDAGFALEWDATVVAPGLHRLTVRAVDRGGRTTEREVMVDLLPAFHICLDSPTLGAEISGDVEIRGWAAGSSPVVKVEFLCIPGLKVACTIGVSRPDVAAVHPALCNADTSGFVAAWNVAAMPPGTYQIRVRAVDVAGRVAEVTGPIQVGTPWEESRPNTRRRAGRDALTAVGAATRQRARDLQATAAGPSRFAVYAASAGNYFFGEIRDLLVAGLKELGADVVSRDERLGYADADWHIVVAPHEFFVLGDDRSLADQPPDGLILLNTEQPSTQWFRIAARQFSKAAAVWDMSLECAEFVSSRGFPARFLPLGFVDHARHAMTVDELPDNAGTCFLAPSVRTFSNPTGAWASRPLDVFFVGHASLRREEFFAQASAVLSRFHCYLHLSSATQPVIPGVTTALDSATVAGLIQRSKVVLNIHHGRDQYFEWHRVVMQGIWQRALVISETGGIAWPFRPGIDFIEVDLAKMPAALEYYLETVEGRKKAEAIARHGFETLTTHCRLADSLRSLLADIRGVRLPDGNVSSQASSAVATASLNTWRAAPEPTDDASLERTLNFRIAQRRLSADPDLTEYERAIIANLSQMVDADDEMFPSAGAEPYLKVGLSALRCIRTALERSHGEVPDVRSVLDLPCGHGRALRFIRAAWPAAAITACDIEQPAVEYCAGQFNATAAVSNNDFSKLELAARFELIWCGSLLTHLDEARSLALMACMYRHLAPGGVCVFTTQGALSVKWMRSGQYLYGLERDVADKVLQQHAEHGYGYADYANTRGYGISLSTQEHIIDLARSVGDWRPTMFLEAGWDNHQDVFAFQRAKSARAS